MPFQAITLADRAVFEQYLGGRRRELITYCFANFYLWREWDPYSWAIIDQALVIKSDYLGLDTICVPLATDDQAVLAATATMIEDYHKQGRDFIISEADAAAVALFEQYWPGRFVATAYTPGANYLYRREDLAALSGKNYAAKRNFLRRFIRENPGFELLPFDERLAAQAASELAIWNKRYDMTAPELTAENCGVIDALRHFRELDCQGAALLVGDHVAAFTIGSPLNDDTYAIHIEKANTEIVGAYAAINCLFARDYLSEYTYINRAEDMDDEGLRRAKNSYHPCRLVEKYYLRLR